QLLPGSRLARRQPRPRAQLGRGVFLICFLVSMGDYDVLPARADRKHANSPQQMTDSGIRQWLTKYSLW
ncbi:hypothetical protein, partial [Pseudomonas aeruginosa]|uniref:hypothetical protein n=1 Tax=Pseudomonas aeruginosa TaxID=287 RepID=UPI001C37DE47